MLHEHVLMSRQEEAKLLLYMSINFVNSNPEQHFTSIASFFSFPFSTHGLNVDHVW